MKLKEALETIDECGLPYKWSYDSYLSIELGEAHFLFSHAKASDIESGKYKATDLVLFSISTCRADIHIDEFNVKKCCVDGLYFVNLFKNGEEIGDLVIEVEPSKCILDKITLIKNQGDVLEV